MMPRRVALALARAVLAAGCAAGCQPSPPAASPPPSYAGPPGKYRYEAVSGSEARSGLQSEPAAGADAPRGMSAFEAGVAAAVNRLRQDPAAYATDLDRQRRFYRENYLYLPGVGAPILTREGVAAVDDAIRTAHMARPLPALRLSRGLSAAARAHAAEVGAAGTVDHRGRDRSQPFERMMRHGRVRGLAGENIGAGWGDADEIVRGLFVDDGVSDRGHRLSLLEPEYHVLGVGCAWHKPYHTVCVLDMAGEFREAD